MNVQHPLSESRDTFFSSASIELAIKRERFKQEEENVKPVARNIFEGNANIKEGFVLKLTPEIRERMAARQNAIASKKAFKEMEGSEECFFSESDNRRHILEQKEKEEKENDLKSFRSRKLSESEHFFSEEDIEAAKAAKEEHFMDSFEGRPAAKGDWKTNGANLTPYVRKVIIEPALRAKESKAAKLQHLKDFGNNRNLRNL